MNNDRRDVRILAEQSAHHHQFNLVNGIGGEMEHGDCGEAIGWWTAGCCAGGLIPCLGYVSSLAYLVLLIIYLVKINGLREQLAALANPRS